MITNLTIFMQILTVAAVLGVVFNQHKLAAYLEAINVQGEEVYNTLLDVRGKLNTVHTASLQTLSGTNRLEIKMGVVKDILTGVQADLDEYVRETDDKVEALLKRDTLDESDKAALQDIQARAKALAELVPNAVTLPLPDPQDTTDLNPTEDGVLNPEDISASE